MTFGDLAAYAAEYRNLHPMQRRGQAHFNAVDEKLPEVCLRLTGTASDPFYNDDRLPAFWAAVWDAMQA